jgi:hypothetical protein
MIPSFFKASYDFKIYLIQIFVDPIVREGRRFSFVLQNNANMGDNELMRRPIWFSPPRREI